MSLMPTGWWALQFASEWLESVCAIFVFRYIHFLDREPLSGPATPGYNDCCTMLPQNIPRGPGSSRAVLFAWAWATSMVEQTKPHARKSGITHSYFISISPGVDPLLMDSWSARAHQVCLVWEAEIHLPMGEPWMCQAVPTSSMALGMEWWQGGRQLNLPQRMDCTLE